MLLVKEGNEKDKNFLFQKQGSGGWAQCTNHGAGCKLGDDEYFEGEITRFPHGNSIGYMKIEESRTL